MTSDSFPATTDVLVTGAGPVGLALATALGRLGVDVTLIDLRTDVRTDSRAAGVQPHTLEDLARIGAAQPLVERGLRGPGIRMSSQSDTLLEIPYTELDTGFPYLLLVSQATTEEVLRGTLADAGGRIWSGYRLLEARPEFDAVAALVTDAVGAVRSIRARYLVGCDGLHSGVRDRAGIAFEGQQRAETYALADVRMTGPQQPRVAFTFSPEGLLFQSTLPDGIVRLVATVPDGTGALDQAGLQRLIDHRCGEHDHQTITEVVRSNPYQITSRLAAAFRQGRIFLAGDAAHVHSPAGGQGMNTGIQDAVNLSWKLAAVLGGADPALLDSYEAERRPNAAGVLAFTGQLTTVAGLSDPAQTSLRDGILARLRDLDGLAGTLAHRLAQLDISYRPPGDDRPARTGRRIRPAAPWGGQLAWARLVPPGREVPAGLPGPAGMAEYPSPDGHVITVRPDGYVAAVS